jgi:hypothetical protein
VLGWARVAELAEESGLPPTTVYRLPGPAGCSRARRKDQCALPSRGGPSASRPARHAMERLRNLAQRPLIELAATTPVHVYLGATTSDTPMCLHVFNSLKRLPFQLAAGDPKASRPAGTGHPRTSRPTTPTRSRGLVATQFRARRRGDCGHRPAGRTWPCSLLGPLRTARTASTPCSQP